MDRVYQTIGRARRLAHHDILPFLSVIPPSQNLYKKIVPDMGSHGHILAIILPSPGSHGEQFTADFMKATPLPFQLYFSRCALAKPFHPLFMHLWSSAEEYEWRNQHIRWQFKRVLNYIRPITIEDVNETDVGAMIAVSEIPSFDRITFFDTVARRSYTMHAQTATNILRMALEHQDHMFPTPHAPRNPYTNQPFGIGQLVSIYSQLNMRYEKLPLSLVMFRTAGFNITRFENHYGAHLRWRAIHSALRDKDTARDMICAALESMYRETMYPQYPFLVDSFNHMNEETAAVLGEIAKEYMELSMARVVRNPARPSNEHILHAFRTEVMNHIVNPRLQSTSYTMSSLLSHSRALQERISALAAGYPTPSLATIGPSTLSVTTNRSDSVPSPSTTEAARRRTRIALARILGFTPEPEEQPEDVSGEIITVAHPVTPIPTITVPFPVSDVSGEPAEVGALPPIRAYFESSDEEDDSKMEDIDETESEQRTPTPLRQRRRRFD